MKPFIFSILFAVVGTTLLAYPIDPRPLRKLIMESDYIISGHVIDVIEKKRKKGDHWEDVIARIKVTEVLQGILIDSIIEVPFSPYMICPAPARYVKGTDIITFLSFRDRAYHTQALSYGLKTLSPAGIEIYKARIQEMQLILKIKDEDKLFMETVDWLVRCAENEATRWEGTYELSPASDFMSYYARSETPAFEFMLSDEQKLRIKNALLTTMKPSYSDLGLVDLVYLDNQEEVYRYLLNALKNLDEDHLWIAEDYMQRILYRTRDPELEKLLKEFSDKRFERGKEQELVRIVKGFVSVAEK